MRSGYETLKREHLSSVRPIRCEGVTATQRDDGTIVIRVPAPSRGWLGRLLHGVFRMPGWREVELEPVGAFVWSLCDGRHTGKGVSEALSRRYQINQAEADASLAVFLSRMAGRGLIRLEPVGCGENPPRRRRRKKK
ncbi:MAG: PqqD family protein [Fimbriimonadales bacterium]|nr:PqqD family protein [Fimbriimonadales bacterium]